MYLRAIRLRDWKAFTTATFEFPAPTRNKNVVLIGAKNGFGKTSLLEALILGLYGRDGMPVLARAVADSSGDTERSYDEFLQRCSTPRRWCRVAIRSQSKSFWKRARSG